MNEVTEVGAKGKKAAKKAEGATFGGVDGQIGRLLVRSIWAQEWTAANPDGKPEDRKAAWKDARSDVMEKNLKTYRRALNAMTRSGVTMAISPDFAKKADEDDVDA